MWRWRARRWNGRATLPASEIAVVARPAPPGLKRWVVLVHTYLGVAFALLFVMWFASGIVLAYNTFPLLTEAQRLARSPQLNCATCRVTDAEARVVAKLPSWRADVPARLGMLAMRPVWRILDAQQKWHAVFGDTAAAVPAVDSLAGANIAAAFLRRSSGANGPTAQSMYAGTLQEPDQWTLEQPLPAQLPLLRYDMTDDAGTRVYISQAGAEVVTVSTRRQRTMAWLGAIPHWIYPALLRRHVQPWSLFIIVLSAFGTLMCATGLALGISQWRWRERVSRTRIRKAGTPYRDRMMRWHHIFGLLFGVFVCSWMFSGLMSMNPGHWNPGSEPDAELRERWASVDSPAALPRVSSADAWRVMRASGHDVAELRLERIGGRAFWKGQSSDGHGVLVNADSVTRDIVEPSEPALIDNATRALGGAELRDAALLESGDDYFRETPEHALVAPVLRLRFDDAHTTWLYVDRATGSLLAAFQTRSRADRWLYSGLHDFDFRWLLDHRPLWDIVVVGLSLGGLLGSLSGVVLALRWLRDFRRPSIRFRRR